MPVSDFIPTIWTAVFLQRFEDARVWGSLTNRNYQGSLSGSGNTVKVPVSASNVSVGDYVSDTEITAAPDRANGNTVDLVINQQKFWRVSVDDIVEAQTEPSLMEDILRVAADRVADVQDEYLMGIFDNGYADARNTTMTAALDADAWGKEFLRALTKTKRMMDQANVPEAGRWMVVNPRTIEAFENYILGKSVPSYTPATDEGTLRNGFSGTLSGFRMVKTNRTPEATVSSKKHDRILLGQGNIDVTVAETMRSMEAYRPENLFADNVKALYVYGAKMVYTNRIYSIQHLQE